MIFATPSPFRQWLALGVASLCCLLLHPAGLAAQGFRLGRGAAPPRAVVPAPAPAAEKVNSAVVLAEPGLRAALADNTAVTVGNNFTPSVAFNRQAILFGTRLPALPAEGDMAKMRETIIDPRTGIAFELAVYPGFRMVTYHLSLAWGQVVLKPEHVALLLG